jgi:hypothetical protein
MFYFLIENKNQCLLERHFDHTIEKVEIQDQSEFIKHLQDDQPELIYLLKSSKPDHLIKKIKSTVDRKKIKCQEKTYHSTKEIDLIREEFLSNIQTSEDDPLGPIYLKQSKSEKVTQAKITEKGNILKKIMLSFGLLVGISILFGGLYLYKDKFFKKEDPNPEKKVEVAVSSSNLSDLKPAFKLLEKIEVKKRKLKNLDILKPVKLAFSNLLYNYTIEKIDEALVQRLIDNSTLDEDHQDTQDDQDQRKGKGKGKGKKQDHSLDDLIIRLDTRKQEEATLPCNLDYTKRLSILCLISEPSKDSTEQIIEFTAKIDQQLCTYDKSTTTYYAIQHTLLKYCEGQEK